MNVDGTLFASVDQTNHSVCIYSLSVAGEHTADAVVVGTSGISGSARGQLDNPVFACFVHRNGIETLLICDSGNDRVVEVTAAGEFCRAIAVKKGSYAWGIAYCCLTDVIAVSLNAASAVVLLQYESGAVKPEVTIGLGRGSGGGQLSQPLGVTFTADGRNILVADFGNHRVSKFSATSGAFIAHVISSGICRPRDVLQCEDGSIVVAQGAYGGSAASGLVCVGEDGTVVHNIIIPTSDFCLPCALSYSSTLNLLVVKTVAHGVFLLRDPWMCSSRNAWLSALSCF